MIATSACARTAAAALALLLLGCGGSRPPAPPPCPSVLLLKGAERTAAYRTTSNPRPADLEYLAVLNNLVSACGYDDQGVDVALRFNLIVEQGPAFVDGATPQFTYFVTTMDPEQQILSKDLFDSSVAFEGGANIAGNAEEMTVRMPGVATQNGSDYRVYVGFQLDDAEISRRLDSQSR